MVRKFGMNFGLLLLVMASLLTITNASEVRIPEDSILLRRYYYSACRIDATISVLNASLECASKYNITIPPVAGFKSLEEHITTLMNDKDALLEAASTGKEAQFNSILASTVEHIKGAINAIREAGRGAVGTPENKKNARACLVEEVNRIKTTMETCQMDTFVDSKDTVLEYYDELIAKHSSQIERLKAAGVDTKEMEDILDTMKAMRSEIEDAFDNKDMDAVQGLRLRQSRHTIHFDGEGIRGIVDYAQPIVAASNNSNKEQILSMFGEMKSELARLNGICPLKEEFDGDWSDYANENKECWDILKDVGRELKEVRQLWIAGKVTTVTLAGSGTLIGEGNGTGIITGSGRFLVSVMPPLQEIPATATLTVTDYAGDAKITIYYGEGNKIDYGNGTVRYEGFYGEGLVTGPNIRVQISGNWIRLVATGKGRGFFQGRGWYKTWRHTFNVSGDYVESATAHMKIE